VTDPGVFNAEPGALNRVCELYLDGLRDKTHRGFAGRISQGLSAGGRIFGYRIVPATSEPGPGNRTRSARYEFDAGQAGVVRRIFRDYTRGRSMKAIAHYPEHGVHPVPRQGHQA